MRASAEPWRRSHQLASSDLQPTGVSRLWAAALLDGMLGFLMWALCATGLLRAWGFPGSPLEIPGAAVPRLMILAVVLHVVYHVTCIGGFGQTLGKRAMGIAVVRRNGAPTGYGRAFLRSVGGLFALLTLGLANLGVLVTRERRGLGDWLADTRVVRVPMH